MNIFVLDRDPKKAAQYQCDKHVVKMILESAQMLVSAYYENMGIARNKDKIGKERLIQKTFRGFPRKNSDGSTHPYGVGYFYHPCTQWSRATKANWWWLWRHAVALCEEYTKRYGKHHKTEAILLWMHSNPPVPFKTGNLTPFVQAMPEDVRHRDAVKAYRDYYCKYKKEFAKWNHSQTPKWYKETK